MSLSTEQFVAIQLIVRNARFTSQTLEDDVLDHLCCAVEERMSSGESFEPAVICALDELAPQGLEKLQHETDVLLFKNTITMKKAMYAIGLAASMSFTMGLMMKILHLPGGEQLLNYGFLAFLLIFMPMLTVSLYKSYLLRPWHEKLRLAFGIISAVLTGFAIVFKIMMSLEWGEVTLMTGASVFAFGFLPLHFYGMYKKSMLPLASARG